MAVPRPSPVRLGVIVLVAVLAGVALPAMVAAATPPPASYVALGDSYTAGPLIPNQIPDPLGCFRSDHDYSHLVARARSAVLRDVSCSGATTDDLFTAQSVLGGSNPPQLDALDGPVTTVTLQMGGNDIGFLEIVARCAALLPVGTPCRDTYTAGGQDEISRRIAATAPKIAAALAEIRRRSPHARILVVGYPAILPDGQLGCWPWLPIAPGDVPYLVAKEKELNAMLASQAAGSGAGVTYVDVYGPSIGHDACELPGVRWVEPLLPLSPAAPVHPNALGMAGMAAAVLATLGP